MKLTADENYFEQAARFDLRCACEECAFFDGERGACVHGYPTDEHRESYYRSSPRWIVPCKDFEVV